MPIKGDQFYGYVAVWEGIPFYQPPNLPTEYGSCIVLGSHPAGETLIIIDGTKTVLPLATGDTVIFNNIAYLILEYNPMAVPNPTLLIYPALLSSVFDGTIGNVVPSATPPTTFRTAEAIDPKIKLVAHAGADYLVGALELLVTLTAGEPEPGQKLIVGGDESEIQYTITNYDANIITIASPGLQFPITTGTYLTQTRKQQILIEELVGTIFLNDVARLNDYFYQVVAYQETPEAIIIADPGIIFSLPLHTLGTIYH